MRHNEAASLRPFLYVEVACNDPLEKGIMDEFYCQTGDLLSPSKRYPRVLTLWLQLRSNLKQHGLLVTGKKAWFKLVLNGKSFGPQQALQPAGTEDYTQVLRLQPGEIVEVKSEEEIRRTLDANGRNRNLGFMPEMWSYCGQQLPVLKRVEKICLENEPRTVRRLGNTVILEGAFCKGSGIGCDRACFYFWRECWLKRVSNVALEPNSHGLTGKD
jgi:hypothetical protein